MPHLLPSLHIVLTCSFVLLLAYLLFTILSFLASSLIHGSSTKATRRGSHRLRSSSSRKSPTIEREIEEELQENSLMDRLQEEEQEEEEEDTYTDAATRTAPMPGQASRGFDLTDTIFEDRPIAEDHDVGRDKYSQPRIDDELSADIGKLGDREIAKEAEDKGRYRADAQEVSETFPYHQDKGSENGQKWEVKEGQDSVKKGSNGDDIMSSPKMGDPQGSGSQRQRLPPTWSDLEKIVNMSSSKDLLPPSAAEVPSLLEED